MVTLQLLVCGACTGLVLGQLVPTVLERAGLQLALEHESYNHAML